MAVNRNPQQRGFSRNGAPRGYGQQRGQSPFLDNPQSPESADAQGGAAPMAHERGAPAAPAYEAPAPPEEQFMDTLAPQRQQFQPSMQRPAVTPIAQSAAQPGQAALLAQALQRQPQASTGSGDFGKGARFEQQQTQPYPDTAGPVYGDPTQPALTQQPQAAPQGDMRAQYAREAAANNYRDIEGAGNLATGNFMGNLEGFNTGAWGTDERGANTHKNTFGKIASRYDPTQPGATRALMADPDFQAYFPDARIIEHPNGDLIDFGDGNPVDVLRGAREGGAGEGWQWGVDAGGAPAMGPGGAAPQGGTGTQGGDQLSAQLMAALQGGGGQFGDGSVSIEQLLEALGLQQQAASAGFNPGQPQF